MSYTDGLDKPDEYFNTITYSGDGSFPSSKTGVGFAPDFIWIKRRNIAASHVLSDIIRGTTKALYSESTTAELTSNTYGWVSSFNSDGFSVDQFGSSGENVNASGSTYVAWNWLANGAGVSNTDGTITSTVSANTTSGFSIVSYTGTGANATVGHGLGVAPKMIIVKSRSNATGWLTGHDSIGWNKYLVLNTTSAENTATTEWNGSPTSTYFTLGSDTFGNGSGRTYIAYCFAEKKGFSKFGKYTGNGSTDGSFIYTGMRPAFVMHKRTDVAGTNWGIIDNRRNTFNVTGNYLSANTSNAENSDGLANYYDFLSNGFKIRNSGSFINASGGTYIYMAFAEHPFVSSTGTPTTAR